VKRFCKISGKTGEKGWSKMRQRSDLEQIGQF
jgi:hypothetical protein